MILIIEKIDKSYYMMEHLEITMSFLWFYKYKSNIYTYIFKIFKEEMKALFLLKYFYSWVILGRFKWHGF